MSIARREIPVAQILKAGVLWSLLTLPLCALAGVSASMWQLGEATPLMTAAKEGNLEKVQALLARGTNVNEQTKKARATALIFAAAAGRTEVVKFLLKHGANPNLCSYYSVCPIWWAAYSGSYETVKTLIEAGADIGKNPEVSSLEYPTLQTAVFDAGIDVVRLLLDHGAEIEYTNIYAEETALAVAVRRGKTEIAALLIERGADLSAVNKAHSRDGKTALQIAKAQGRNATVELIENALKSGEYNRPKYSVDSITDKLYRDPTYDLSAQDKDLVQFLRKQTKETLRRIRNTIFARKNYQFDDPQLTEYFRKRFPSYKPAVRKYDLSDIDKRNVQYMKEIEEYRAARDAAG